MEWRKKSGPPTAWAQPAVAATPTQVDQFESVLRQQAEAALGHLRQVDEERGRCIERIAAARKSRRSEEERLAEDEHLHLTKRRTLLLRRIWFIQDEHKQARMLRAILEDQAAKREIVNARRAGALEGAIGDPVPIEAELDSQRRSLEDRLKDVMPGENGSRSRNGTSAPDAESQENRRAIDEALRQLEVKP